VTPKLRSLTALFRPNKAPPPEAEAGWLGLFCPSGRKPSTALKVLRAEVRGDLSRRHLVNTMCWIVLGLASIACYGGLFIAGFWVFRLGYDSH
jgi:hypothetical protein